MSTSVSRRHCWAGNENPFPWFSFVAMVKFHHFSGLEYLLSRCGVVSVHSWVGMCKCICIYIYI